MFSRNLLRDKLKSAVSEQSGQDGEETPESSSSLETKAQSSGEGSKLQTELKSKRTSVVKEAY